MTIKQVSVFLENKAGRTQQIAQLLADNDIDILAFSLADSSEFGILRLIVNDTDHAARVLKNAGIAVILTDVIRIDLPNKTGYLAHILKYLQDNSISIEYMYALQGNDFCSTIIRPYDMENCKDLLNDYKL